MVNNSTDINKTNNDFPPQIIEHWIDPTRTLREIQVNWIPTLPLLFEEMQVLVRGMHEQATKLNRLIGSQSSW